MGGERRVGLWASFAFFTLGFVYYHSFAIHTDGAAKGNPGFAGAGGLPA